LISRDLKNLLPCEAGAKIRAFLLPCQIFFVKNRQLFSLSLSHLKEQPLLCCGVQMYRPFSQSAKSFLVKKGPTTSLLPRPVQRTPLFCKAPAKIAHRCFPAKHFLPFLTLFPALPFALFTGTSFAAASQ
jgi:hypothetical protein